MKAVSDLAGHMSTACTPLAYLHPDEDVAVAAIHTGNGNSAVAVILERFIPAR